MGRGNAAERVRFRNRAETNDAKLALTMSIGWRHHGASRRTYSTGEYTSTEKGQEYKQCVLAEPPP